MSQQSFFHIFRLKLCYKFIALILFPVLMILNIACITSDPVKVGILHSQTGTMAISEKSIIDATQMAIDEINAKGGLLGRHLESVIHDGKSDDLTFAIEAEKLINKDNVKVIFGCWTSSCRKLVKPIVEKYDHLLFYPVQYEGMEQSPNIFYTGSTPNQQITPAVHWCTKNLGKRFYLVSSNHIFPHAANTIIKKQLAALGAELVGEYYIPLGSKMIGLMIDDIILQQPDVILNTINGDSNLAFFAELHSSKQTIPVMSFSIAEDEINAMDINSVDGHYCAQSYFQSYKSKENREFVTRFKKKYGSDRTTNAFMESAYFAVKLWAKAAIQAKSFDPSTLRQTLKGLNYLAPEGDVLISSHNNHTWKPLHIGQIQPNAQLKIIWSQTKPIRPLPYPFYRSKKSWHKYLDTLYKQWGNQWSDSSFFNPQPNMN